MKSWLRYQKRFLSNALKLELPLIEKCLIFALIGSLIIQGSFVFTGRNIGDANQIKLAKLQTEQGLMAAQQPH